MSDPILDFISSWPRDVMFDARRAIKHFGDTLSTQDIVAFAITEYIERLDSGEVYDVAAFVSRFPEAKEALLRSIGRLCGDSMLGYPRIGETIAGQTILRYLSLSAESQVYLSRDMRLDGLPTVLKVTHVKSREPVLLSRLNHPSIVKLLSVNDTLAPDRTLQILEYRGDSTLEAVECKSRTIEILLSIAKAIAYAHAHGIVHNDVCRRNIVLGNGNATLIDFNAAVLLGEHGAHRPICSLSQLTMQSLRELVANGHFMSPCDESIDNFAFVVLCYHTLTGGFPWGDSAACDEDSCRAAICAREQLALEHLDHRRLSKAERRLFLNVFNESEPCPSPVVFVKRLMITRRWQIVRRSVGVACTLGLMATAIASSFRNGEVSTLTAAGGREGDTRVELHGVASHSPHQNDAFSAARMSEAARRSGSQQEAGQPSLNLGVLSGSAAFVGDTNQLIIRPEIALPLANGDHDVVYRVCQSCRSSLNCKEKAILAYVVGIVFSDASAEMVLTEAVIRMGHADAAVYSNHSFALFRSGRRAEALRYLETAMKLDPSLRQARLQYAVEMSLRKSDITKSLRSAIDTLRFMPNQRAVRLIATNTLSQFELQSSSASSPAIEMARELEEMLISCSHTPCEPPLSPWAEPYASSNPHLSFAQSAAIDVVH